MLEPFPSSPSALDTPALAFEHILASLARLKARMDALERRAAIAQPPPWPDPNPPYTDWNLGRGNSVRERPVMTVATAVTQQPLLGFGGPSSRGQHYGASFGEHVLSKVAKDPGLIELESDEANGNQDMKNDEPKRVILINMSTAAAGGGDDKKRKQDHVIDRDDPKPKTKKAYLLEIAKKHSNVQKALEEIAEAERDVATARDKLVLVDGTLDRAGEMERVRNAADVVWVGVELYRKWQDKDLLGDATYEETLQKSSAKLGSSNHS
ncbi:hypothetical protein SASPL_133581 [Salvia splendens]|uniref:Uncharacterized protein n=1 Tax=Salvia splendens TaxID=180675 RepID=A0A8X8X392_SALSN|nr:hypothetical protein SASPL_133581 [Salvia splendens]